jgi:hypothetical protein
MAITPQAGYMVDPNNPNGVVKIGSVQAPAPVVTPPAEQTPAALNLSSYIAPTTTPGSELAQEAEANRLAALATPESESDRRTRITNQFQGEIDALNALYAQNKQEAIQRGAGRLGSDAAIQNRRGLIGSSFGAQQTSNVEGVNAQDVQAVENERANALAGIYSKIRSEISQNAKEKEEAMKTSASALIELNKNKEARAKASSDNYIKNILASNIDVKDEDLNQISEQLKALGIDPVVFKRDYITALEAKKQTLEDELAAKQKAEQEALKNEVAMTKPFAV